MSVESGLPSGKGLAEKLLSSFFPTTGRNHPTAIEIEQLLSKFPFEAIVWAFERSLGAGRQDLVQRLSEILLDPTIVPKDEVYSDFLSLLWNGNTVAVDEIFTTNYDELLEKYIGEDLAVPITPDSLPKASQAARDAGRLAIVYLRGKLTGSFVITEDDVFNEDFTEPVMERFRNALYAADAFVFVGYSMVDPDFRRIYHHFRAQFEQRGKFDKLTYVVAPPSNRHEWQLGNSIWEARKTVWITMGASSFFSHLKIVRNTHFDRKANEILKRRLNIENDDVLNDKIMSTASILNISPEEARNFLLELRQPTGIVR